MPADISTPHNFKKLERKIIKNLETPNQKLNLKAETEPDEEIKSTKRKIQFSQKKLVSSSDSESSESGILK